MRLISLLNHYQHFPGFVYDKARHCAQSQTIEITVRPRRGSKPVCSGCHKPGPGYDHLGVRRFEFVPVWGCMVVLLYCMRRVDCRACGVRVEAVPWGIGKHQLTKAYMLFLAHWARKLSWQETALSFCSTWDKVCQSVEYVVQWGLEHQKGEKVLAIVDNNGFVLAPLPVAPVNEADTVLLPDGLNALKRVARLTDLKIDGSYLNLDGGFDSRRNRKAIFNAGLVPNIKENPRNRKSPKR